MHTHACSTCLIPLQYLKEEGPQLAAAELARLIAEENAIAAGGKGDMSTATGAATPTADSPTASAQTATAATPTATSTAAAAAAAVTTSPTMAVSEGGTEEEPPLQAPALSDMMTWGEALARIR